MDRLIDKAARYVTLMAARMLLAIAEPLISLGLLLLRRSRNGAKSPAVCTCRVRVRWSIVLPLLAWLCLIVAGIVCGVLVALHGDWVGWILLALFAGVVPRAIRHMLAESLTYCDCSQDRWPDDSYGSLIA